MDINLPKLKKVLINQVNKKDVIANNLANVNNVGFKKDVPFFEVLSKKDKAQVDLTVKTDFSQGDFEKTNNVLDLAIAGDGFFTIEIEGEEAFTRDGHFKLDQNGTLINSSGNPVIGYQGWVVLTDIEYSKNDISISESGEIFIDDNLIDRLKISKVEDLTTLEKIGANSFSVKDPSKVFEATDAIIKQGFLEKSNVNPVEEMMGLIEIQRQFESTQKIIRSLDETFSAAANQIGRYT